MQKGPIGLRTQRHAPRAAKGSHNGIRTRQGRSARPEPPTGPEAAPGVPCAGERCPARQRASRRARARAKRAGAFLCAPAVGVQQLAAVSEGCEMQEGAPSGLELRPRSEVPLAP